MRTIKFREFINGKFHYWGFVEEGIFKGPVTPSLTRGKHDQFTGLHDKNGNEIYEGDYFLVDNVKLIVIFEDGKFCFDNIGGSYGRDFIGQDRVGRLTIAGNIHANPELL